MDRRTTKRFAHALEKAPEGGASVTHKEVVRPRCSSRGEFEDLILVQFSHFLFRSFLHETLVLLKLLIAGKSDGATNTER